MTRLRCSSENEFASPVVPSTLSPSQPLASRERASAVERAQSGAPSPPTAVAIAAITPLSLVASIFLLSGLSADVECRERGHIGELGVIRRKRRDLNRAIKTNKNGAYYGRAAQHFQELGRDRGGMEGWHDQHVRGL